jgi:hypothetical protein
VDLIGKLARMEFQNSKVFAFKKRLIDGGFLFSVVIAGPLVVRGRQDKTLFCHASQPFEVSGSVLNRC